MNDDGEAGNNLLIDNTRRGVLAGTVGLLSGCSGLPPGLSGEGEGPGDTNTNTNPQETEPSTVPTPQQAKLTAAGGDGGDEFGRSVAVDSDTVVIGNPADDNPNGNWAGSAYVFSKQDGAWHQDAKLSADDGDRGDRFGYSVAIDGETAVVGALSDEDQNGEDAGSAYVFWQSAGEWVQKAKLTPDDGGRKDYFGKTVAVAGETAVIGSDAEAAYVFSGRGGEWTQQAKLTSTNSDDLFGGTSVAIDGETVVVGARYDSNPNGERAGAAYVFSRHGGEWTQQAKLIAADGDNRDWFGHSVTVDGETVVIGAHKDEDPNGEKAGSAYVFSRNNGTWSQQAKLIPDDGESDDWFGWSVTVDGETAVIGALGDFGEAQDPGAGYVFSRHNGDWTQQAKLTPDPDDSFVRWFGESIAVDGETAVIARVASGRGSPWEVYVSPLSDE